MTRTTLAVAADYADALLVARRAKNCLFLVLLLVLLLQVAIFVLYRTDALHVGTPDAPAVPTSAHHAVPITLNVYRWVLDASNFLGMTMVIVLGIVLLLTSVIMLVGRLIGVSHLTSAFVWCVFLGVILFPWQSLLNSRHGDFSERSVSSAVEAAPPDQKLPGVLYTWTEVAREGHFSTKPVTADAVLHWMRFAGWPAIAVLLLMLVQVKSSRGLKFALGESDIPVELGTVTTSGDVIV